MTWNDNPAWRAAMRPKRQNCMRRLQKIWKNLGMGDNQGCLLNEFGISFNNVFAYSTNEE